MSIWKPPVNDPHLEEQTIPQRLAILEILLARLTKLELQEAAPIDVTVRISATNPYVVAYRGRKHIFIFSPISLALSLEDYGTLTIPSCTWVNLAMPPGLSITAPGQAALTTLLMRCTDEIIP